MSLSLTYTHTTRIHITMISFVIPIIKNEESSTNVFNANVRLSISTIHIYIYATDCILWLSLVGYNMVLHASFKATKIIQLVLHNDQCIH